MSVKDLLYLKCSALLQSGSPGPAVPIPTVYYHDNVAAGWVAPAHIQRDKAHSSLSWLIAAHVTPSKATLPLY